ncbi:type I DNA topoisomerase [Corynebacterium phoceense]|uniref:type I DNA topoisomerase n=1 Tax=Corynebacterium phoceense TaxID=1686286 RepID=UPI001D341E38|nr:type I DNA topoisomerase [Corynebacterium phoceense]HJG43005.1 type I DNA topoisomerase [Corynebacterium phoceense]
MATGAGQGKTLVIVESATKAKKIQPYLGDDYIVEASVGHIRDLPRGAADVPAAYKKESWARLGVNPEDNFTPLYVISPDKKKKVADLKSKLKQCDQLYLATDPDREGEAIAWHLLEVLKPKVPVRRMVFNEITKSAILEAAENTRDLDVNLIDAQETRRILDRLYGYEVSPVLWKKVMPRLSAGRVQSVATRVIVERERERMAFISADYWDLGAKLAALSGDTTEFEARLTSVEGRRVALGRDFDDRGQLKTDDVTVVDKALAEKLAAGLEGGTMNVANVEHKPYTRKPYAPFMTSTLQQEAGRRLHFTSERTMRIAQRLYENGHITYMRTDSTALSQQGLNAARSAASSIYGAEYVADSPRVYDRKVKNSQEAHEAIRPAGETFATPGQLAGKLDAEEFKLYDLIWKRTVACQMADAKGTSMKVTISGLSTTGEEVEFSATGRTITFPGFLKAYEALADAPSKPKDGKGKGGKEPEARLPHLNEGDQLRAKEVTADGHSTNPPARYTEASLVKKMEDLGIGRPSTYASIIKTIQDRGYVLSRGNALVPSWVAFAVIGLMENNFGELVDYDFTSSMEDELDAIAAGNEDRTEWLNGFYFGNAEASKEKAASIARHGGLKSLIDVNLEAIDARQVNSLKLYTDSEGRDVFVRVGRYGPYIERAVGTNPDGTIEYQRANLSETVTPDELTEEFAEKLFATPQGGRELGTNPANGRMIVAKEGRFGPYVTEVVREDERAIAEKEAEEVVAKESAEEDAQRAAEGKRAKNWETKTAAKQKEKRVAEYIDDKLKPATASLFSSMEPASVTLEEALKLLSLPREVGTDDDGEVITAQNGRYGPYLKKGNDSRSLANEEQLFTITLDEARRIYAEPKRRGRQAAQPPLKQLGNNDVSGKPMTVKDGRFGPYVTDGTTNASLRRGDDPEKLTDARANELLSERRAKEAAGGTKKAAKKGTKKTSKAAKKSTKKTSKATKKSTKKATKAAK